jgi:hypothetical protein
MNQCRDEECDSRENDHAQYQVEKDLRGVHNTNSSGSIPEESPQDRHKEAIRVL